MAGAFDQWAEAYEAMIDWPKRLANETPLFRWVFERAGARRVLDAACGTGHHAAMFHSWGLEVEGADISPAMIERCRAAWGEKPGMGWVVRGFDQPAPPTSFDVAVCTGNSLALAGDLALAERAVRQLLLAVRPGGLVVLHVLNLWRLPDGECQWQKCARAKVGGRESLIIKGVHRAGQTSFVDMLVTDLSADPPGLRSQSVPFLGLTAGAIELAAHKAGAAHVEFFGNYAREAYDAGKSPDLIAVVRRSDRTWGPMEQTLGAVDDDFLPERNQPARAERRRILGRSRGKSR